jgi:hypothetical protein
VTDLLSGVVLGSMLASCPGPFAIERQGETFEASAIVAVSDGDITFTVDGVGAVAVLRSDIIRLIPGGTP